MLWRIHAPLMQGLTATVCPASSLSLLSSVRWESSKPRTPPHVASDEGGDDEDFNMIFNDDFQFLDECFGEGGVDVFDYIPEHDAALLGHHDKR